MSVETTSSRRIVSVIYDKSSSEGSAMTVIISYTFFEGPIYMDVSELSVYSAYPNTTRLLYHSDPVQFQRQIENAIKQIDGANTRFNNKTVTIL
jgi:hypothetical protein